MIGSQKQIELAETIKTYSVEGYHNVRMILVLSSQRFPYLFFSRMATFSPSFLGSNEISRLQNVSLYVSLKDPLVRFI